MNFSILSIIWLVLTLIFIAAEGLTTTLISVWFALGAFAALIASGFTSSLAAQGIVFFSVSILVLIFLRPLALRKPHNLLASDNMGQYIGKTATVIVPIHPPLHGRVRLDGVDWNAMCTTELTENALCRISGVNGTTLTVTPLPDSSIS